MAFKDWIPCEDLKKYVNHSISAVGAVVSFVVVAFVTKYGVEWIMGHEEAKETLGRIEVLESYLLFTILLTLAIELVLHFGGKLFRKNGVKSVLVA